MTKRSIEQIPAYLQPFIAKQNASLYTPIDHAGWRFILKIGHGFFKAHAHGKYLNGLRETGISTEKIPLISEMDECLQKFGWRAVPVSGFIPPSVFLEFLSLGVLPIACEMRRLEHLAYTPAPDIVHEAAGHAPIIADPEYADYLFAYGDVSRKAIFSSKDLALYEAIRELSEIKEDPKSSPDQILASQEKLEKVIASSNYVSEATCLARMSWWSIEYGLVGDSSDPKIYGAGLLSSAGESYNCFSPQIKKVPFTMDCTQTSYDITKPQPQLYITPDFQHLTQVLNDFSQTMAYKKGGIDGLAKAKMAGTVITVELDSEIQMSGVLTDYKTSHTGEIYFLKFEGPTQLAHKDQEIEGQGATYHKQGFSTPIGLIVNLKKSPSQLSQTELEKMGFKENAQGTLHFESGIELTGILKKKYQKEGKNLIFTFENCTIQNGSEILYKPEWGSFDLACGSKIPSVFGGAADREKYLHATGGYQQNPREPKTNLTSHNRVLGELYQKVRQMRETKSNLSELESIYEQLNKNYPQDWLLRYEILELNPDFKHATQIKVQLAQISKTSTAVAQLISRGLELLY